MPLTFYVRGGVSAEKGARSLGCQAATSTLSVSTTSDCLLQSVCIRVFFHPQMVTPVERK